jgi:hypothetical protein
MHSRMVDRKKVSGPICGLMRPRPLTFAFVVVIIEDGHHYSDETFDLLVQNFEQQMLQ